MKHPSWQWETSWPENTEKLEKASRIMRPGSTLPPRPAHPENRHPGGFSWATRNTRSCPFWPPGPVHFVSRKEHRTLPRRNKARSSSSPSELPALLSGGKNQSFRSSCASAGGRPGQWSPEKESAAPGSLSCSWNRYFLPRKGALHPPLCSHSRQCCPVIRPSGSSAGARLW